MPDYSSLTDEELIARYYDGDDSAFEELHERYWKRLFRFFLRRTGNRDTAEDLAQETLVKIMMTKGTLKEYSPSKKRGLKRRKE